MKNACLVLDNLDASRGSRMVVLRVDSLLIYPKIVILVSTGSVVLSEWLPLADFSVGIARVT
ncbi:hypothetical protein BDR06DRAFT_961381, partial [Suillus hirtellus]